MACVLTDKVLTSENYASDVSAVMDATLLRFGEEEWHKVVLTNEIHGHLGIYSTLGAKMGVYAMSLHDGDEEPRVLSYAGSQPPVSCFNDGLQVSTGATMGHGLFSVDEGAEKRVEALFQWSEKTMRLRLKPAFEQIIKADIKKGVEQYGHTPPYWDYVRKLAIKYWSEWNRNEIFETI